MLTVVASLKGGTGKSTLAFNLGVWLQQNRTAVQLLDLDPQGTLTDVVALRHDEGFEPFLDVSSPSLQKLRKMAFSKGFWLADVSVGDNKRMEQVLLKAGQIVVPVPPSQADVWSLQRFLQQLNQLHDGSPPSVYAFINRADTHVSVRESDETADALSAIHDIHFLNPRLGQRTVFRRSFSEGLAVFELEPRSKASLEFNRLARTLFPKKSFKQGKSK